MNSWSFSFGGGRLTDAPESGDDSDDVEPLGLRDKRDVHTVFQKEQRGQIPLYCFFLGGFVCFFWIRISGQTGHPEIVLTCAACEGTNPVTEASGRRGGGG